MSDRIVCLLNGIVARREFVRLSCGGSGNEVRKPSKRTVSADAELSDRTLKRSDEVSN